MTRLLSAAAVIAAVWAAYSWEPRVGVPVWYGELCAEVSQC